MANIQRREPYTVQYRQIIASITKTMTAIAIMQLYEKGKLDLDVPIQTYLPDFPISKQSITIRHILSHTSGIPHYKSKIDAMSFSHYESLDRAQISEVEMWVNDQIRGNLATQADLMDMATAKESGAIALFGEKYGDVVRVLRIGSDSIELCGGTHVSRAGDIGLFKIVDETGIAAGIRRIEAVTGATAIRRFVDSEQQLDWAAQTLKVGRTALMQRIEQLQITQRTLEKELESARARLAAQQGGDLASQAQDLGSIRVLAARLDGANPKTLRDTVDQLKNKLGAAAVVLSSVDGDKVSIIAGVTKSETGRIPAGDLANHVAEQCGGRGGGRPDMAQAGGNQPQNLDVALASVADWVRQRL